MKLRIEFDDNCKETEIVIRCREMSDEVANLQKAFSKAKVGTQQLILYRDDTEYFLPVSDVIFFESDERAVNVHTVDNVYTTKLKLYELEEMFPQTFMRVSKSSIVNFGKLLSITKTLNGCFVSFPGSVKQVYVSRMYYKPLKDRMEESRI